MIKEIKEKDFFDLISIIGYFRSALPFISIIKHIKGKSRFYIF